MDIYEPDGPKPRAVNLFVYCHGLKIQSCAIPVNVEVVWALLKPKRKLQGTRINHIVVASVYYSSTQTSRVAFLDHISESYHALCSNYGSDLKFIIGGDVNRLNIKPILSLSAGLTQMVKVPTRKNPDAILDIIITNISALYEQPYTLQPAFQEHRSLLYI